MQEGGVCGSAADRDVIADMRRHAIALSYQNYAVWRAYRAGTNPALTQAISIMMSNRRVPDGAALARLYERFCREPDPISSLDIVSSRALTRARQLTSLVGGSGGALPEGQLEGLAQELVELGQFLRSLAQRLLLSEERIGELEACLSDARLEASTDGLTGVANRRAFEQALRLAAGGAMNAGEDLSVILADIDHFKMVNDRWGHRVGDDVLRTVAQVLTRTVRGRDLVARYGGEEFAIILPRTARRGAMAVAENLRLAVRQQSLLGLAKIHAGMMPRERAKIAVTVSLGVSCYEVGESLEAWLARADAALYQAKGAGRDRSAFGAPGIAPSHKRAADYPADALSAALPVV